MNILVFKGYLSQKVFHFFGKSFKFFMLKSPWEIENIQVDLESKTDILSKFIIYDDSKLIKSSISTISTTDDFVREIKNSQVDTGIMISSLNINNTAIYLLILDNRIFIIKQVNLPKIQDYFNEHKNLLIFMTYGCKEHFLNSISSKDQIPSQPNQVLNEQRDINIAIINEIIDCIIKKSQYRTIKMRQELLPNKFNSKNDNYKLDDFISIQSRGFNFITILKIKFLML